MLDIKLKLKSKILLPVIVLMVLVVIVATVFSSVRFSGFAQSLFSDSVDLAARSMIKYLRESELATRTVADSLASSPEIRQAVVRRDTDGILRLLGPSLRSAGVDSLTVTDSKGVVLARTHEPMYFGDSIIDQDAVKKALSGRRETYYCSDMGTDVAIRTDLPIYDRFGALVGVISAGIWLDRTETVDYLKEHFNAEFTVYHGGKIAATTIYQNNQRIADANLTDKTASIVVEGRLAYFDNSADILGEPFSMYYYPLTDAEGEVFAIIAAGNSNVTLVRELNAIIFGVSAIGAAGLLIAILILYRIVAGIIKPVKRLGALVSEVSRGNLHTYLDRAATTKDEIGELILDVYKLIDVIEAVLGDISRLTQEYTERGDFEYRIDTEKYSGTYKEIVGGMNALLGVTVDDILLTINYLEQIINGKFDLESKQLPGKKVIINIAVENLRRIITGVNTEISHLVKAAIDGELKTRGVAKSFEGDWSVLIGRLNKLMEVWETYLDICPEALLILDKNLKIVYTNKLYDVKFGKASVVDMIYRSEHDCRPTLETLLQDFSGGQNFYQFTFVRDGKKKYFSVVCTPIIESGEVISVYVLATDTTDLTMEKEKALEASRAKSEFLSRVSHELRTPMNAIIGMSNIGSKEAVMNANAAVIIDSFSRITNAGKHLLSIINDVLDMSRMEAGKLDLHPAPVNIGDTVMDCVRLLMQTAEEKKISLSASMDDDLKGLLMVDAFRLRQVLINLLNNAIKFTDRHGKVLLDVLLLDDKPENSLVQFRVSDNGIGMSPEFMENMFIPFEQDSVYLERKYEGTGLGLSICHRIITQMGGAIDVFSEMGKGSVFQIRLLLDKASPDPCDPTQELREEDFSDRSIKGMNILLVDDIEINRMIVKSIFEDEDVNISEAEDGAKAVEIFSNAEEGHFGLIFMDIQMPVMDGYQATKAIRKLDRGDAATVTIIAVTANALSSDAEKALEIGMDGHIAKPVDFNEVISVAKRFCGT